MDNSTLVCRVCGHTKPLEQFRKHKQCRLGHERICLPCHVAQQAERHKRRFADDPESRKAFYRKRNKLPGQRALQARHHKDRRALTAYWLQLYKRSQSCACCGLEEPACLDFHHRDPSEKRHNVSHLAKSGYSVEDILAEIAKCDCLCRNCHSCLHTYG